MLRLVKNPRGQTTAEYAVLLGLVIAVVIGMQTYVKRGWQARVKVETDAMVTGTNELGTTGQYEPYYAGSEFTTATNKDEVILTQTAKNPRRTIDRETSQSGTQTIAASPND